MELKFQADEHGSTAEPTALALARQLQSWAVVSLDAARYIVSCSSVRDSPDGDKRCLDCSASACIVAGSKKRQDNVRASLKTALLHWTPDKAGAGEAGAGAREGEREGEGEQGEAEIGFDCLLSICVDDVAGDLQRAARVLLDVPAGATVLLKGWTEDALRAADRDAGAVASAVTGTGASAGASAGVKLRWVPRSQGMSVLSAYVTPDTVLRDLGYAAPHGDGDATFSLCPPAEACQACRTLCVQVYKNVHVDVRAALCAATRDGYDVSALYDTRAMEGLQEALQDCFRVTFLAEPSVTEAAAEVKRQRKLAKAEPELDY
jgi:hypothetical protein